MIFEMKKEMKKNNFVIFYLSELNGLKKDKKYLVISTLTAK